MQSFLCHCQKPVFFGNSNCLACQSRLAMCPGCRRLAAMKPAGKKEYVCCNCSANVRLCQNYVDYAACTGGVEIADRNPLCRYCRLNEVIPDLTIEENLAKWQRLELTKHRVLYDIDRIGLPIISDSSEGTPVLAFAFKSSTVEPVSTGHERGRITVDIMEADSVQRERIRVSLGETQRTLVGHFRHELGHYYWDLLVQTDRIGSFRELFGDEREPTYAEAQKRYYARETRPVWLDKFISEYATMHPWEDFAETFAAYLDMVAIVETARHFDVTKVGADGRDFEQMLKAYREIGIVANEFNRDMGLLDLVPEILTETVVQKLRYIDSLRR